jgi:DNA-binding XRE family transcriptional regulator
MAGGRKMSLDRDAKNAERAVMVATKITAEGMNKWGSGDPDIARKEGFTPLPVIKFGDFEYVILRPELVHPGHNTAEVVNVTEFNRSEHFRLLVTEPNRLRHSIGNAWIAYGEEGGVFALAIYTPKNTITDMEVSTAVLSYRIVEPTRDDMRAVREMLDEELDVALLNEQVELALRLESRIQQEIPGLLRQLRQDTGWTQTELGRRLGISQQYIGFLEAGERPATAELQQKIAALLFDQV